MEMNDEEARVLRSVLENYTAHLDVEIHRTERHEFREALERREKMLHNIVGRLEKGR